MRILHINLTSNVYGKQWDCDKWKSYLQRGALLGASVAIMISKPKCWIDCNLAFSEVKSKDCWPFTSLSLYEFWRLNIRISLDSGGLLYIFASLPRIFLQREWVVMEAFEAVTLNFPDVSSMHAASHFRGVHICCVCLDRNWVCVIGNGSIFKEKEGAGWEALSNGEGCGIFQRMHNNSSELKSRARFRPMGSNRPSISTDWSLCCRWCRDTVLGTMFQFQGQQMGVQCLIGSDSFYRSISLDFHDFPCVFLCVCPIISTWFCSSKHLQIQGRWNFGPQGITKTQPWSGQWWDLCPYDTRPFETTIRLVLNSAAEWVEGRNHGATCAHKQMSQMNQSEQEGVSQEHVEMAGCFPIFPRSSLPRAMYCSMKKWLNSPEGYRFGNLCF